MAASKSEFHSLVNDIFILTRLVGFRLEKHATPFTEEEERRCLAVLRDAALVLKRADNLLAQESNAIRTGKLVKID